jgi:hypothetical protein
VTQQYANSFDAKYHGPSEPVVRGIYLGTAALSALASARLIYVARIPGNERIVSFVLGFTLLVSLCVWAVPGIWRYLMFVKAVPHVPWARGTWLLGAVTPVLFAMTYLILYCDVPRRLMFSRHRAELNAWATQVLSSPSLPPTPASIGPYTAFDIKRLPNGGMRFVVTRNCGIFWAEHGFAFSPSGTPTPGRWDEKYTPAGDGWYYLDIVSD